MTHEVKILIGIAWMACTVLLGLRAYAAGRNAERIRAIGLLEEALWEHDRENTRSIRWVLNAVVERRRSLLPYEEMFGKGQRARTANRYDLRECRPGGMPLIALEASAESCLELAHSRRALVLFGMPSAATREALGQEKLLVAQRRGE
jgi:hypothetical protein